MSTSLTVSSTCMEDMSVIVIELPDPLEELELDEPPDAPEPPELPPLEDPLDELLDPLVPAETAEPTEMGSAVMTPSLGAVTTVSPVFFLAVS